ncbi:ATP-dependent helicase HrpB [Hydrogenimonas cancrithermarum]|uniref:ATP-dependent helicase HrpB n=2 Tax=Hydrogenimonas cancrithermarum TaxID=2993563 RepID=A0ABN6WS71_9BACT|nr:ATP-dependent helicase HrpB [Hydrogenimonas cancrithermarum]
MLEPRRLAARAAALRMAETLGERVGETVGYRMKGETKVTSKTRIEVVTEGVLTRMLQSDPELHGMGLVIFDEFHERSLQGDLGLALTLQAQEIFREDLKILVMSATLEGVDLARVMPEAPTVRSEGRSFPVEVRYLEPTQTPPTPKTLPDAVVKAVLDALRDEEGSLLAFLPGAREIRRVEEALKSKISDPGILIAPLYGAMDQKAQRLAIEPAPEGHRKVVLATNIAETSLTIEGVRVVVDGGFARRVRFDERSGMDHYETLPVSRNAATQRAGRAGRTAPGVCYRLWHENRALVPSYPPDILTSDLSPMLLDLAAWGAAPEDLAWIDTPPEYAVKNAKSTLISLNMMKESGVLTELGKAALKLGLHPRLAHMLLVGKEKGAGYEAALLAASLSEGTLRGGLIESVEALHRRNVPDRLAKNLQNLLNKMGIAAKKRIDPNVIGPLAGLAYPERIARRRGQGPGYQTVGGRGLKARLDDALAAHEWLAAAYVGGEGSEATIFAAAPLEKSQIEAWFGDRIETVEKVAWNENTGRVEARRLRKLGNITLSSEPLPNPDGGLIAKALLETVRKRGLVILPWSEKARRLRNRALCVNFTMPGTLPDPDDETLMSTLEKWLLPWLEGAQSLKELQKLDLYGILAVYLGYEGVQKLDRLAPERLEVPSGSKIAVDYGDPSAPVLAARLQELFGWMDTPRICEGRVWLTVHLLSPARRPLAVTTDLKSFWTNVYPEVKKEMHGRYPKHYWPENPFEAVATNRTKKHIKR